MLVLPDTTVSVNSVVLIDPSPPPTCKTFMPLSVTSLRAQAKPSKFSRPSVGWQRSVNVNCEITIKSSNTIEVGRTLPHHENLIALPNPSFQTLLCLLIVILFLVHILSFAHHNPAHLRKITDWNKAFQLNSPLSAASLIAP